MTSKPSQATSAKQLPDPKPLPVKDLLLDPQNPRLAGLELTVDHQDEILKVLWRDRAVNELIDSIATSGYWTHEELFVTKEHGKLVVIEGNRRLAAGCHWRSPEWVPRVWPVLNYASLRHRVDVGNKVAWQ